MPAAKRVRDEPVELVRSDLHGSWLLLALVVVVGSVVAATLEQKALVAWVTLILLVFVATTIVVMHRIAARNALFIDDTGVIVVTRGRAQRGVAWERVTSARWHGGSFWTGWDPGGVVVTVDNESTPVWLGSIVIVDPAKRADAGERVDAMLAAYLPARDVRVAEVASRPRHWWHDGVLYHVYLRSFADSDGDGVGDIPGLISKLDYLAWLGVDGIWVSPVMPSPNEDWGYDIADYTAVDPHYGTMDDVGRLIDEAGARGMRVVFDLVPNHSSIAHPWFIDSRSARTSAKRDWYVWADPGPDGGPPNNWVGNFFGPSWTLDEATGQYYLTSFLPTQADLNWWNPEVRQAFDDVLRFWFDRGIAGFRIDVVHKLVKDPGLPDNPPATKDDSVIEQAWGQRELYNAHHPETHEVVRRWGAVARSYDDPRILVGETYVLDIATMASYYGAGDELDLAFNIPFLWSSLDAEKMRTVIEATEGALPEGAWPVWNGGSHDISRMATRWCGGDGRKIRCALMLLLMLRGTALLYYGDEIGMPDTDVPLDHALDPLGKRIPGVVTAGRDPARSPMHWSGGRGGGFTRPDVEPWLPMGDVSASNVEDQRGDPGSVLRLTRDLIAFRRDILTSGTRTEWIEAPPGVLVWRRGRATVALNLSDQPATVERLGNSVAIGTRRERDGEPISGSIHLEPWEGVVTYE